MMTNAQGLALTTAGTVAAHNHRMGWDIDDTPHAIGMLLADLIVLASVAGVDFDAELASARDTVGDVYAAADITPHDDVAAACIAAPPSAVALTPRLVALLANIGEVIDTTDPESDLYLDSGADTVQALCEHEGETRALLAALKEAR